MPNSTGDGTKSLWTNITHATHLAVPLATALIPLAPQPGTDMVTQISECTLAELAAAISTSLNVTSGLYLPVASSLVNLDAATPNSNTRYIRIGSKVFVSGLITLDATAAAAATVDLTLPIASVLAATTDASGVFNGSVTNFGSIIGVVAGGVRLSMTAVSTASGVCGFQFSYNILP